MTTIFIGLHSKYREITKEPICSRQFELVKSYQEAEKFQLYLEIAALYAADEAFKKVTERPGEFITDNGCGSYGGGENEGPYILWEDMGKECYPSKSSFEQAFENQFNLELKKYLEAYPGTVSRKDYEERLKKAEEQEIQPIDLAAEEYVPAEDASGIEGISGEVPDG